VDTRDARILAELTRSPFAPLESIGRTVGTSGTAVKARLDRLAARGVLLGFAAAPWASSFGRIGRLAVFEDALDADLERIALVEDVAWAARSSTGAVGVMIYVREPIAQVPAALAREVGGRAVALVRPTEPESAGPLSPLDWRVMDAVVQEPRATLARHAELSGLNARTVRQRREALRGQGMLLSPIVDATREPGEVYYNAYVSARSLADIKALRIPSSLRVASHDDPPAAFLVGHAPTYAAAQEVERKLRALPGAQHVTLDVPRGMVVATDRLRGWIAQELDRWTLARRKPAANP
jgi:DNA-binding Lrp family transcriptional regulator